MLRESASVLDVSHALGLSGPSRLHEQFVAIEASSPGEFKTQWRDLPVDYGFVMGPFGEMLIAQTRRGVCLLSFVNPQTREYELARMHSLFRLANLREDTARAAATADAIFRRPFSPDARIHLAVQGTNFQVSVWRALLRIPEGSLTSYRALAESLGMPRAARAVASAIAANPINYLIPCHRVIRSDGTVGGYRGGAELKGAMLAWESSVRDPVTAADATQE
ncbi:MAG: methylated-DNA--[protein]-cysteine S-methyltransferase [Gammaproteobacteria bacterium]